MSNLYRSCFQSVSRDLKGMDTLNMRTLQNIEIGEDFSWSLVHHISLEVCLELSQLKNCKGNSK